MAKTLGQQTNRVTQISRQVDNVSIRQAYPSLGQNKFVTYNGAPWKGVAGKAPNETWVHIYIDPESIGDFSPDQIEKLLAELKSSNFTPFLGRFGIGGPYMTSVASVGSRDRAAVFYFKKDLEQTASIISGIVLRTVSITDMKPQFVNLALFGKEDNTRFIAEQSGMDCQIYFHAQK